LRQQRRCQTSEPTGIAGPPAHSFRYVVGEVLNALRRTRCGTVMTIRSLPMPRADGGQIDVPPLPTTIRGLQRVKAGTLLAPAWRRECAGEGAARQNPQQPAAG